MQIEELERRAAKGDPLPDGMVQPEQLLYLSLRALYREYRSGQVSKEQAGQEKNRLLDEYRMARMYYDSDEQTAKMRVAVGSMLVEADRNGCEICKKIARVFDGREK